MESSKVKYNSIDMPLRVFINAMVDHDYSDIENFEDVDGNICIFRGGNLILLFSVLVVLLLIFRLK